MRKRCSKCGRNRDTKNFGRDKYRKDGLTHWCLDCRRESNKATQRRYAEANKQRAERLGQGDAD